MNDKPFVTVNLSDREVKTPNEIFTAAREITQVIKDLKQLKYRLLKKLENNNERGKHSKRV